MQFPSVRVFKFLHLPLICLTLTACGDGAQGVSMEQPDSGPQAAAALSGEQSNTELPGTVNEPEENGSAGENNGQAATAAGAATNQTEQTTVPANITFTTRETYVLAASLPDQESNDLTISWSVATAPTNGELSIDTSISATEPRLNATVAGAYTILLEVTDGDSTSTEVIRADVVIPIPPLPAVEISIVYSEQDETKPTAIKASHPVIESLDSEPLIVSYIWYRNGERLPYDSYQTYSWYSLKRDDSYTVEVKVTAGEYEVTSKKSAAYVVENTPPSFRVLINPAEPTGHDDISLSLSSEYDQDGDPIDFSFEWFRNDVLLDSESSQILPAGYLVDGDTVFAKVSASDGYDTKVVDSSELIVANTPPSLVVTGQPDVLNFGELTTFHVEFIAADGTPVATEMLSAPEGLDYDASGNISWTPTPLMLSRTETYHAYFKADAVETQRLDIVVQNSQHKPVIARSGVEVPRKEHNMFIGNFDSDTAIEILSTDSDNRIFTIEADADKLRQDWLYPYDMSDLGSIVQISPPESGSEALIVVHTNSISRISSRDSRPEMLYQTDTDIVDALYEDVDQDGQREMVLLMEGNTLQFHDPVSFAVIDTIELVGFGSPFYDSRSAISILAGDVDNDDALEIITSAGEVFDGATRALEWQHADPFGRVLAVGDINGNGQNQILGTGNWDELTSFDAYLQSDIAGFVVDDICSVVIANTDSDAQEEVVTADCQHGSVKVYDASTGSLVLQHEYEWNESSNSTSLHVGDVDDDGIDELIWARDSYSGERGSLYVASVPGSGDTSASSVIGLVGSPPLDTFDVVGRAELTPGNVSNVFLAPSTGRGSDGVRVVTLSDDGVIDHSEMVSDNWHSDISAELLDSDADSVMEILLAAGDIRSGELQHRRMDDFSLLHTNEDLGGTSHSKSTIADFTQATMSDGTLVVVMGNSDKKIRVYDLLNQTTLWVSAALSSPINAVQALEQNGALSIVVATNQEISKWTPHSSGYIRETTVSIGCSFMEILKVQGNEQLACIKADFASTGLLTTLNLDLVSQSSIPLTKEVTTMRVLAGDDSDQILIGAKEGYSWHEQSNSELVLVDPANGLVVWSTDAPIGKITGIQVDRDNVLMHSRARISTSDAIYITQH